MEVLGDLLCRHEKNIKQKKVGCQNVPLSGDYAEIRTGGVGRHALRIASEPPPLPPLLPLLLELLLRPPPPPPLPPPPPALLELLGELAEGAAGAEDPGEAQIGRASCRERVSSPV